MPDVRLSVSTICHGIIWMNTSHFLQSGHPQNPNPTHTHTHIYRSTLYVGRLWCIFSFDAHDLIFIHAGSLFELFTFCRLQSHLESIWIAFKDAHQLIHTHISVIINIDIACLLLFPLFRWLVPGFSKYPHSSQQTKPFSFLLIWNFPFGKWRARSSIRHNAYVFCGLRLSKVNIEWCEGVQFV